jgi:hypothetical protein
MSSRIPAGTAYIDANKADQLIKKWSPVLEYTSKTVAPIQDEHTRLNTSILLENQEQWCLREANVAGGGGNMFGYGGAGGNFGTNGGSVGNQDFYATGDARLPKVLIPMIRRTFPELITNEIVGVQPMSGPVGLAFALRYRYEGENLDWQDPSRRTYDAAATSPRYRSAQQQGADGQEVGYNYLNTGYTGTSSAKLSGGSAEAEFTFLDEDKGVAEWLANYEMTGQIPQMTIEFEKTAVEAGTRRLAAKWSVELEQDLKNMNGIDIDNELTNAMSYEVQAEIDREMVMRMIQIALNAGRNKGWSTWSPASADGRWLGERNRDFYQKVLIEANRIAVRNRRGAANFIIATPTVCSIMEMMPEFKFMPVNGTVSTQQVGVAKVGTLAGRFTVYRDTRTESQQPWVRPGARASRLEYALLGYKGSEYYDTGIVYCPYIPVMVQRTIGPNDFTPRVGLMTRYGVVDHLFGADLYYHVIIVKGLGERFTPGDSVVYL